MSNKPILGFTVVELIVVITTMGLLMGIVFGALSDFYTDTSTSITRTTQDSDTLGVLRSMERELSNGAGFAATVDPGNPLGSGTQATNGTAWSYCGADNNNCNQSMNFRVLISKAYATDKGVTDPTRNVVLTDTGSGCDITAATYAQNSQIYFVAPDQTDSSKYDLYRRTIVNTTGGTLCSTPAQRTTCSYLKVGATLPFTDGTSTTCQRSDVVLLRSVQSFKIDYYNASNDANPYTDAEIYGSGTTPPAPSLGAAASKVNSSKSIRITVTTSQKINGSDFPTTASIRISRSY